MSYFMCQVSCVTCPGAHVTCQVMRVKCHLLPKARAKNYPIVNFPNMYNRLVNKDRQTKKCEKRKKSLIRQKHEQV